MRSHKDEMLQEAADTFERYRELHAAKGTKEGRDKAEANLHMAQRCRDAIKEGERDLIRDRKFKIHDGQLVNRVSGVPIPEHEPVFVFRARDRHALAVLAFYNTIVADPGHRRAISESIGGLQRFLSALPTSDEGAWDHGRLQTQGSA